jgi:DNA-binding beta-propeller fold protein YncE
VASLIAFSIAGEKMPWLTTHITLPLILVAGWAIGTFIDRTDWGAFRERRAWLVALLMPVTIVALAAVMGSLGGTNAPFQGSTLDQLQDTGVFVSAALVAGIGLAALYGLGQQLGFVNVGRLAVLSFFGVLALLTARTAFIAAYVNYDYANEFLVYAHASRGVRTVMEQVEDLSMRIEDGLGMKVAYDSDVAWPMTWYFRNYTDQAYYGDNPTREQLNAPVVISGPKHWSRVEALLGNRYYSFEYIRMVWPMQDYWDLTWERISYAWGDAEFRQALWDIWYERDYTRYGAWKEPDQSYELSEWPVSERMRLYVRKDIAGQIWSYGVGPTVLEGDGAVEDPYLGSRQDLPAAQVIGSLGTGAGNLDRPRDVAVGLNGDLYVADTYNHRIQKFDAAGNFVLSWGSFGGGEGVTPGPGQFNEPWGVAVGPDGSVYVADTWNHRVQKFDSNGGYITAWGFFGQAETADAFWGPRDLAVDAEGRVYVADTGNKRIAVFDANGASLTSVGFGGSDPGQFDEPVGLAVTDDGLLFVADTWNQRVQVFQWNAALSEYAYVREWPVIGWYGQSLDNKPYLATDGEGRVYVGDPEGYRVLVFDTEGRFLTTWGDFGVEPGRFALVNGIAVDPEGNVWVADAGNNRIVKFAPVVTP